MNGEFALSLGQRVIDALAMIRDGGPIIMMLAAMSVIALALLLAKLWEFALADIGDRRTARVALTLHRSGENEDALRRARDSRNPAARAMATGLEALRHGAPESARREATRVAADALAGLGGWMRPLEVIAATAPLLGLLGTVLGMIDAFAALEQAGDQVDPAVLSGGIWQALLTTAAGLAVAIPTIFAVNWLERRLERAAHEAEFVIAGLGAPFAEDDVQRSGDRRPAPEPAHA